MSIEQRNPAPTHVRGVDWPALVAEILDYDGEWCSIGEFAPNMASYVKNGCLRAFIPEGIPTGTAEAKAWMRSNWQIKTRTVSKSPHRVEIFIRPLLPDLEDEQR